MSAHLHVHKNVLRIIATAYTRQIATRPTLQLRIEGACAKSVPKPSPNLSKELC